MGWVDLHNFLDHKRVQIVALCDVDSNNLDKAAKEVPGARLYADWRELLQKEGDKIDSVNAAVPDHTHFSIAYSAIARGKHVYCQKPLCHDVAEVRTLTEAAIKHGVHTQLGTQVAATIHDRTGVQWLRDGRIGKVTHAYLCSNRPGAVEAYLDFLKSGGSKFPLETLQTAGVDMRTSAPVESTLRLFDRRVTELEGLL